MRRVWIMLLMLALGVVIGLGISGRMATAQPLGEAFRGGIRRRFQETWDPRT